MGGLLASLFKKKTKSPDKDTKSISTQPTKPNRLQNSNSPKRKTPPPLQSYPQPLWALATAPNPSSHRGPRLPGGSGDREGGVQTSGGTFGPRKVRVRSLEEEERSPRRRRIEEMTHITGGIDRMNLGAHQQQQSHSPPPRIPIPSPRQTSSSNRGPLPSPPIFKLSPPPLRPPQLPIRPLLANINSTSIYPQAFPTPPRMDNEQISRGADPFIQSSPTKSNMSHLNAQGVPRELASPIFPGAFPNDPSPPSTLSRKKPTVPSDGSRPMPIIVSQNQSPFRPVYKQSATSPPRSNPNQQPPSQIYGPNPPSSSANTSPNRPPVIRRHTDTIPVTFSPQKPSPTSTTSTPNSSPSKLDHKDRCHGTTTTSKQCTRIVNGPASSGHSTPTSSRRKKAGGGGSPVILFPISALDVLDNLLKRTEEEDEGTDGRPVARVS